MQMGNKVSLSVPPHVYSVGAGMASVEVASEYFQTRELIA